MSEMGSTGSRRSTEVANEIIATELGILARRVIATYRRIGKLDYASNLLLHQIAKQGPAGVKTLADEFGLDISTISRQAATLEKQGYLSKSADPNDGRSFSLQLTDMGSKAVHDYEARRLQKVTELLKNWSDEDRTSFGKLLGQFNETF